MVLLFYFRLRKRGEFKRKQNGRRDKNKKNVIKIYQVEICYIGRFHISLGPEQLSIIFFHKFTVFNLKIF